MSQRTGSPHHRRRQARTAAGRAAREPGSGSASARRSSTTLILIVPSVILLLIFKQGALYQTLSTVVSLAYFTYFEGGPTGQTLGKKALGIRVIRLPARAARSATAAACSASSASGSPRSRSASATSGCCGTRRSSAGRTRSPAASSFRWTRTGSGQPGRGVGPSDKLTDRPRFAPMEPISCPLVAPAHSNRFAVSIACA